jgi:hypothetical protein
MTPVFLQEWEPTENLGLPETRAVGATGDKSNFSCVVHENLPPLLL